MFECGLEIPVEVLVNELVGVTEDEDGDDDALLVHKESKGRFENFLGRQHQDCASQEKADQCGRKPGYIVHLCPRRMHHSG